jgi:CheY-like chemotaxis protein
VLIVAKPPLLHGLAHQLHSLWVSPNVVDASCPEEFSEWLANTTASSGGTSVSGRAVAQQDTRPESEVLIIDAQLLPQVRLAKLPYKRVITLSPPSKDKETVTDGSTQALVPEDLMRPVTRRTLRDVLVAVTGEREGSSGATPPLAVRSGLQQQQQAEGEARKASGCPLLVLVVDDNKVNLKVQPTLFSVITTRRNPTLTTTKRNIGRGRHAAALVGALRHSQRRHRGHRTDLQDALRSRADGPEHAQGTQSSLSRKSTQSAPTDRSIVSAAAHRWADWRRRASCARSSTHEPPVDIVAMTAATSKEDEEECMRSGFTLYLPKPVKYGAVKDLIERKQQEKQRRANALEARKEEEEEEEENPRSSP